MRLFRVAPSALCRRAQSVLPPLRPACVLALLVVLVPGFAPAVYAQAAVEGHIQRSSSAARHRAMAEARTRGVDRAAARMAAAQVAAQRMLAGYAHRGSGRARAALVPLATPWQPVGPSQVLTASYGPVTGRVSSIAVDPADSSANTVYLGTSGGGVWKSTNAAGPLSSVHFAPLTDTLPAFAPGTGALASLSIGAVTVQPGGTGVVLAGTGDPNDALDSYGGSGVLRSADGGNTWTLVDGTNDAPAAGFFGEGFAGFAWSGSAPGLVVAAVSSSAEATLTGAARHGGGVRGLFYSTDAGATWHTSTLMDGGVVLQSAGTSFSSFEGNAATAVVWNPLRGRFYAAVRFHGIYESVDGVTFTRLNAQPGSGLSAAACPSNPGATGAVSCPIFRAALAAEPASGDLFALLADSSNLDGGLWQDVCGAAGGACANAVGWANRLDSSVMEDGGGHLPQADYNLTLAAIPAATALSMTDTLLFAGTGDLYRCSLAGGCSLRNTTNATTGCAAPAGVAPAQHAIAWLADTTDTARPRVFVGNDGGLWRSLDGVRQQSTPCSADDATHFDNLNAALGSLAEVFSLASDAANAKVLLAALGANGSAAATTAPQATGQAAWPQLNPAESGTVLMNGTHWYVQAGAGVQLQSCANGAACTAADFAGAATVGEAQVSGDAALVDAPLLLDPALPGNLLAGTCRVWRGPADNGAAWSTGNELSRPLSGGNPAICGPANGSIRSLAAGGASVTAATAANSGSQVLYAGLAGSGDGGLFYGGRIFVNGSANTADGTTLWSEITGSPVVNSVLTGATFNPLKFDVSSIATDPHDATGATVYATVMGFGTAHVYRSTDRGGSWMDISANLPDAPANAVVVDPNDAGTVYVATDTGVYVTSAVGSCGSVGAQCWNVYGTGLPNAPALTLVASAGVTVPGALAPGALRVGTFGRGIWQIPLLTGGALESAGATLTPATLSFGAQAVGSTSAPMPAVLTNTGNVAITTGAVNATAGWQVNGGCANTTLAAGAGCTLQVSFAPLAGGAQSGTLTVQASIPGGVLSTALQGTGTTASSITIAPASLVFGSTDEGSASATQVLTVSNGGSAFATLEQPVITGDFQVLLNTCPAKLAAGSRCQLSVSFVPTGTGTRTGELTLADENGSHGVALSGTGVTGHLAAAPATLPFPDTTIQTVSAAKPVVLTNTGTATLVINSVSVTGDFAETDSCNGVTLAVGGSCTVQVSFAPLAVGVRPGTLTLISSSGGGPAETTTVALGGNGTGSFHLVLTPASLDFGAVLTGTQSAVQNISVGNNGVQPGALGPVTVTSDFVLVANTCPATLAANTSCALSVAFKPAAAGPRSGLLSFTSDAGTQTALLAGTGILPATDTLAPAALSFASQIVGTTSTAQQVTLTNSGDQALAGLSAQLSTGDFQIGGSCGAALPAHSSCVYTVVFAPRTVGSISGVLTVSDAQRSQTVTLNGVGMAGAGVTLTPSSISFSNTGVGLASAPSTATLTNNGGVAVHLNAFATAGDFGILAGSNSCPLATALQPGASCTLQIAFAPTAAGARTGSLVVSSDAPAQTVQLAGSGVDFSLAASGASAATVSSGNSATYALLLRPAVSSAEPVTFTCSGAPANARCNVVGTYADLSAVNPITVTLSTGVSAARAARNLPVALTAILLPMLWPWRRRLLRGRFGAYRSAVFAVLLLAASGALAGCGAGRELPSLGPGGAGGGGGSTLTTPAGTYSVVVGATSAGLTRQVTLTLTVR